MSNRNDDLALFQSRSDAASKLAERLKNLKGQEPLVLTIPRGAVPMGRIVADSLEGDLDLLLIHKFTHNKHPELDLGSVTEDGEVYLNRSAQHYGYSEHEVESAALEEIKNLQELRRLYSPHDSDNPDGSVANPEGRLVIIVDDGMASVNLLLAATRYLSAQRARKILFATPIISASEVQALNQHLDVCMLSVTDLNEAASIFYQNFDQVSDFEVFSALRRHENLSSSSLSATESQEVRIKCGAVCLSGYLQIPQRTNSLVILGHGGGAGRFHWHSKMISRSLQESGIATLLIDLLDDEESLQASHVTNSSLLAHRLNLITEWFGRQESLRSMNLGYYGSGFDGAAIIQTAAEHLLKTAALAVRDGRMELSESYLRHISAPTLLITDTNDHEILSQNRAAFAILNCEKQLHIMPDLNQASEKSPRPENLATLVTEWFKEHFRL